jgi:hypothetical protein
MEAKNGLIVPDSICLEERETTEIIDQFIRGQSDGMCIITRREYVIRSTTIFGFFVGMITFIASINTRPAGHNEKEKKFAQDALISRISEEIIQKQNT